MHVICDESEGLLGHDVVEVLTGNFATVRGSTLKHLFQFLHIHRLSELLSHTTDVGRLDEACVIIIEKVKDLVDAVLNQKYLTLLSLSPNLEVNFLLLFLMSLPYLTLLVGYKLS